MKIKKLLTVLLALVLLLSTVTVAFAVKGPNDYLGYIYIYSSDYSTEVYLYNNYTSEPIGKINGATYNKSTNTLSLNNFNQPALSITTNTMGDDFKINLVGDNHIQHLGVWGDFHGGSCEFTGSGKLFVNENKMATNAIGMFPEGTLSVLKAGDSTTITSYAAAGGRSLYVSATEDKNCIQGNASASPKAENVYNYKSVAVITGIDSSAREYEVYTKQGSKGKFAVIIDKWTNSTYYTIYQIVKNPNDDSNILCQYSSGTGDFKPEENSLTLTEERVEAHKTYYSTMETLWTDSQGGKYIFSWAYDSETSSSYYAKESVSEFVKSENPYDGERVWYITSPTDDTTKYADNVSAPEKAGFSKEKEVIDGLYNLTVTASPYTLTGSSHTHSYKKTVKKATLTKNGKITYTCTCGATKASETIYYPKTIKLSAESYTYDGKAKKPSVTVKDSKGKKIAQSNYTVSYASGRKNIGYYNVKVSFKGNYSGSQTLVFSVIPKGTAISSLTAASKAFTVKWKKQTTQTTGYEIQYATDKNFKKNVSLASVTKNSKTSSKISKLTSKKKYFVRVRTYKNVKISGMSVKVYSSWSSSKNVVTK